MFQKTTIWLALSASIVAAAIVSVMVSGADNKPLSDAHIANIRANCVEAQTSLSQLHASDGLMRVNRGQLYESISTKLIAPLNSRLILNRIEPGNLLTLATKYDQQLQTFRNDYQAYEVAMSRTLSFNCVKEPSLFYDSLVDAREKRQKTHDAAQDLQKVVIEFGEEFKVLADKRRESGEL